MHKPTSLLAALALAFVSTLASTFCAAQGVFIFGSAGQSDLKSTDLANATITDDTGSTFSLGLGYQLNNHFALESGYTDLGEVGVNVAGPIPLVTNGPTVNGAATVDISGFFLGIKAETPASENFSIFLRTGVYHWEADFRDSTVNTEYKSETDIYGALGTAYKLTDSTAVDLQISHYRLDSDAVNTYSLGLKYQF